MRWRVEAPRTAPGAGTGRPAPGRRDSGRARSPGPTRHTCGGPRRPLRRRRLHPTAGGAEVGDGQSRRLSPCGASTCGAPGQATASGRGPRKNSISSSADAGPTCWAKHSARRARAPAGSPTSPADRVPRRTRSNDPSGKGSSRSGGVSYTSTPRGPQHLTRPLAFGRPRSVAHIRGRQHGRPPRPPRHRCRCPAQTRPGQPAGEQTRVPPWRPLLRGATLCAISTTEVELGGDTRGGPAPGDRVRLQLTAQGLDAGPVTIA